MAPETITVKVPIRIVSSWPDGVCCERCTHWHRIDFGYGSCEAVERGDNVQLSDGGALYTLPTFACANWEAKGV